MTEKISSPIRNKFLQTEKPELFHNTSDSEWNNWQWQLHNQVKPHVTPYYHGLILNKIQPATSYEFYSECVRGDISFLTSDAELMRSSRHFIDKIIIVEAIALATLPQRITDDFINTMSKAYQVIVNTAFHHPSECSREAFDACARMADAGFIINNQAVLLAGTNDDPALVKDLHHRLLMMRVRPYSLYCLNLGSEHKDLRVQPEVGHEIIRSLRGWTSGLAVPHYIVESGNEKRASLPSPIKSHNNQTYVFTNYKNEDYPYKES